MSILCHIFALSLNMIEQNIYLCSSLCVTCRWEHPVLGQTKTHYCVGIKFCRFVKRTVNAASGLSACQQK